LSKVMQTMAVLLLEMSYEGKQLKEEKADLIQCIKKMIAWLRAMRVNDPVAARAYDVVFKILKTCAPILQEQVKSLLADDKGSDYPPHRPSEPQNSVAEPSSDHWDHLGYTGYPSASQEGFPPQSLQEPLRDPLYSYPPAGQQPATFAFGNPFFTNFDQGVPLTDLQNLWWHTAPVGGPNMDSSEMVLSQQQLLQQQMQHQMHQQMEQAELLEQQERGGGDWHFSTQ
jgi:hypothetical protein